MLEKQARDLARELNDSYLDAYRSKVIKPTKVLGEEQGNHAPISGQPSLNMLRNSKALPFKKYQSEK